MVRKLVVSYIRNTIRVRVRDSTETTETKVHA